MFNYTSGFSRKHPGNSFASLEAHQTIASSACLAPIKVWLHLIESNACPIKFSNPNLLLSVISPTFLPFFPPHNQCLASVCLALDFMPYNMQPGESPGYAGFALPFQFGFTLALRNKLLLKKITMKC